MYWKKLSTIASRFLDFLREKEPWSVLIVIRLLNLTLSLLDKLILLPFLKTSIKEGNCSEREEALREGKTAQLCRFWTFGHQCPCIGFAEVLLKDMLLTHKEYVRPEWILNRDNVKIWDKDGEKVFFSVSDVDFYDVRQHPFSFMNMPYLSTNVLIMSLNDFHRLADGIGDPECRLSLVHISARSGSTLLCQMMNELPRTRVIAEPRIFFRLGFDTTHQGLEDKIKMIRSTIRILCRPSSKKSFDHVFIKLVFYEASYIHLVPQLFPRAIVIFNTRMPVPSLKSFGKVFRSASHYPLSLRILDKLWPDKMKRTFPVAMPSNYTFPAPLNNIDLAQRCSEQFNSLPTPFEQDGHWEVFSALFYFCSLECYLAHKNCYQIVILYEDLCQKPHLVVEKLFKIINEPLENIEMALKALKFDAQNGLGGGMGSEVGYVAPDGMWEDVDKLAKDLGTQIPLNIDEKSFRALLSLEK